MKNDGDLASFAYNTHGGGGHPLPQGKHMFYVTLADVTKITTDGPNSAFCVTKV